MSSITQPICRSPHLLKNRVRAVQMFRNGSSADHVCRKYKISKASLSRWNRRYDGSEASLQDRSKRPHTPHPKTHTEEEIKTILRLIHRNHDIGLIELYGKLKRSRGYKRHYVSLYRLLKRLGFYDAPTKKKKPYVPKPYQTPEQLGVKWQLDVKYVPTECNSSPQFDVRYYQYTMIEEASRERYLFHYMEKTPENSVDFLHRAIRHFKYKPKIIQTDNGSEFTFFREASFEHPFTLACRDLDIYHKLIRPRTPRHNGKVERSHRNDVKRFYKHLKFYSLEDLRNQAARYLYRSNRIPMSVLHFLSPIEIRSNLSFVS